jgi:hypothetical protein
MLHTQLSVPPSSRLFSFCPWKGATGPLLGLPWCAIRDTSSVRRRACSSSNGEQAPHVGFSLATTLSALTPSTCSRGFLQHGAVSSAACLPVLRTVSVCAGKGRRCPSCTAGPVGTYTKCSRGAWDDNGEHLDREREKAGSRTDRGLAQAVHAPSRQKQGWFPIAGNTTCARIP